MFCVVSKYHNLLISEDQVEITSVSNSVVCTHSTHQSTYGHPPAGGLMPGLRVYDKWLVTTVCHFKEN